MLDVSEDFNELVEGGDDTLDVLKFVLAKSSELLNGSEELHQLTNSSAEEIESSEDLLRREIELFTLGHVHESLFGELVLLLISSTKINAALHNRDEFIWWIIFSIPKNGIIWRVTLLDWNSLPGEFEIQNSKLAASNHGSGNLGEESGHPVVGAVVTSNGVDHLDGVH
jgi:hypothetical protein